MIPKFSPSCWRRKPESSFTTSSCHKVGRQLFSFFIFPIIIFLPGGQGLLYHEISICRMAKDELSDSKGYGCLFVCAWAESLIKQVNCNPFPIHMWTPYLVKEQPTGLLLYWTSTMCQVITLPLARFVCKTGLLTSKIYALVEITLFPSSVEMIHSNDQNHAWSRLWVWDHFLQLPTTQNHFGGKLIQYPPS